MVTHSVYCMLVVCAITQGNLNVYPCYSCSSVTTWSTACPVTNQDLLVARLPFCALTNMQAQARVDVCSEMNLLSILVIQLCS